MANFLDLTPVKVGIGVCLFVGGNITAYALLRYRYRSQRQVSQNLEVAALIKQIKGLKKEINELNQSVNGELKELRKEIQQSDRKSRALSVWSYKTACSEEERAEYGQVSPVAEIGVSEVKKTISFEEKKRLFYGKVDELYIGGDEDKEAAMRMLQDNEIQYKDHWEFLWRLGRSHISLHEMRSLLVEKKTHAIASLQYTEEALSLYEPSPDVHKWYAIALGTMTDYIPTKDKITNGFKLKQHILRALELSPSDATLHFMMGRWCYDIDEQDEEIVPRSILRKARDRPTYPESHSSDDESPRHENRRHHLNQWSSGNRNRNQNSNKKKRRRSSDIENNNNNLPKPRLRRSVQLSSVRVGSGMPSKNRLKPYMSRMISRDGSTNIQIKNPGYLDLFTRYSRDIYTTVVDLNMFWVLLLTAIIYVGQWLIFGLIYHLYAIQNGDIHMHDEEYANVTLNDPCVSNVYDFASAFLFSMESETTIGYGSRTMGVVCPWAVTTLVIQCVISAIFDTWLIGLCYAKFASPYLRSSTVVFAKNAVICTRDGKRCLMVRIANLRKSLLLSVSCRARVITLREARRLDGNDGNLQQDELLFNNANSIMLTAPVEYCHVIDETSPLYSIPEKYLASEDQDWFEVVVILSGTIESTGMALHAQTSYLSSEIRYKHRFATILSENGKRNRYIVNFKGFHHTEMEPANIADVSAYGNETVSSTNRKYEPLTETLEEECDEVFELPGLPHHCDNHLDDNQI